MGNCCEKPNDIQQDTKEVQSNGKGPSLSEDPTSPENPDSLYLELVESKPPTYQAIKALFDYNARTDDDLTIKTLFSDPDWWEAKRPGTTDIGWVPSNYVALDNSLEAQIWYFGKISRLETDQLLLQPGNKKGTYLVRLSTQRKGNYALSILSHDVATMEVSETVSGIMHYQIRNLDNGGFYISPRKKFDNLPNLINYYQGQADGLCCQLVVSCPRPRPSTWGISRATRDKWEIPRESIQIGDKLGEGNYGTVCKAKWNGTVDVAVKLLKDQTPHDQFIKEAELMKKLHHRNVLQLYAVVAEGSPVLIVMEFMPSGSLLDYLRANRDAFILTQLVNIVVQVASGMMYLEEEKYIHRDLAARNVLVGENMLVKVADFGMARFVPDDFYTAKERSFPYKWTAPEGIEINQFSTKSDVWSFGVLMYETFTCGKLPYIGISSQKILGHLKRGKRLSWPELPDGEHIPEEMYKTMTDCWKMAPESRPTFDFLFHHMDDFLTSIDPSYKDMDPGIARLSNTSNTSQGSKNAKTGAKSGFKSGSEIGENTPRKRESYLQALYAFKSRDERELSFEEGDTMDIIDDGGMNWMVARHHASKKVGSVPVNYVTLVEGKRDKTSH